MSVADAHPPAQLDLQRDWDPSDMRDRWLAGLDNRFLMARIEAAAVEATAAGARGPVLEVAAAEALHACRLALRGFRTIALEPSTPMLACAREHMARLGTRIELVRGIAEMLPFPDGAFDRVLCDAAIDHFAEPELGVREMARVLRPDGRLVISFVNYGGLSVRVSRLVHAIARAIGRLEPNDRQFWDSPVPWDHTFECSFAVLRSVCERHLVLERMIGVSLGWGVPGWSTLLARLGERRAEHLLARLDRVAGRFPRASDFLVTVWRPRLERRGAKAPSDRRPAADRPGISAADPIYRSRLGAEAHYPAEFLQHPRFLQILDACQRVDNVVLTGDANRSWLVDLMERGPFPRAAVLGTEGTADVVQWLRAGVSSEIDVYELSGAAIRRLRRDLARVAGRRRARVRFIRADLNFASLPAGRYDVVWTSGCLHHIVNLEHLFEQVRRALRPGGLFAFHEYVGERRHRYGPARLDYMNALLREIPIRYRREGVMTVTARTPGDLSPFCGVRSDEILSVANAFFTPVHCARTGALAPVTFHLDLPALEREAPEILARVIRAEREAPDDLARCTAYAVFRRPS